MIESRVRALASARRIALIAAAGISWIACVFDPVWSPQLIESWDFTPTPQGQFFRQKLMELNQRNERWRP
jgi:hypothetical protein